MSTLLKATGIVGSILAVIALVITLLKSLIALVGLIGMAVKILVVVAFIGLFVGVGFLVYKSFIQNRKSKD